MPTAYTKEIASGIVGGVVLVIIIISLVIYRWVKLVLAIIITVLVLFTDGGDWKCSVVIFMAPMLHR